MLGYVGFGKKVDLNLSTEVDSAVWMPVEEALKKLEGSEIAHHMLEIYLSDREGIRSHASREEDFK